MALTERPLAVVTGASAGIGYELAKLCAQNGFDLVVAADQPKIVHAAQDFRMLGADAEPVETDLATIEGVDRLYDAIGDRPVAALLANAGHGLGKAFLDQDFQDVRHVIDTNITGTIYLIQKVGRDMRARRAGINHWIDRRLHSRRLPGRLQRDESVYRLLLICDPKRAEGNRGDGHMSHARSNGNGVFRTRRYDGHQSRNDEKGRSC
jgi:NAD(P)-dependent dehydrogenase (short-subunit alcohol dehydrogenase family)